MTATHVGSLSAKPVAPKPAANVNTPDATGASPFRQRLQDARTHEHAASHGSDRADTHPQRGPDPGRDRRSDPSPLGPHSRQSPAEAARLDKPHDKSATPAIAEVPATPATSPATPAPVAEAVAEIAAEPVATREGDDDEGAAALVEAVLAMIGPLPGKLAGAAGAVATGAADAAKAAQLAKAAPVALAQAGSTATAIDPAALALSGAAPTAEWLKAAPDTVREIARLDAAPAVATLGSHAATMAAPAPALAPVPVAPAHAFAQELGQQVAWFVGHDIKQARIRLHPEEMGSLDLKISVQHNRVDVVLHAQHPGAVSAVQQALPQLDQMLAQQGLSLGHAEVGHRDGGDRSAQGGQGEKLAEIDEVAAPAQVTSLSQLGLVDAFA